MRNESAPNVTDPECGHLHSLKVMKDEEDEMVESMRGRERLLARKEWVD